MIDPLGEIIGSYCVQVPTQGKGYASLEICPPVKPIGTDRILVIRNVTAEREASDRRAFFIAQISHELRTPLQHIMSSVSLINDIEDLSPEDRQRFLRHIEDETYHLGKLVDDLVALSRIEVGHFDVFLEPVRMDELLATVMARLEPRAESNRLRMLFEYGKCPVWAFTDPLRLEQVLLNVLTNACKYAPKGSEIRTVLRADAVNVAVRISDQGPGIPQEAIKYIFDPFSRLASSAHIPGMGLGLYISQQIIQVLGGEIAVNSTLGRGSTFTLQIPRRLDLVPAQLRNQ